MIEEEDDEEEERNTKEEQETADLMVLTGLFSGATLTILR